MSGSFVGAAVKRVEDPRFITGRGRYLANLPLEGALHLVPVRSQVPHGRIASIDTDEARAMPGIVAIFTAADFDLKPIPHGLRFLPENLERPVLALDTVRFVGDLVAVVVGESEQQAADAAALVWVDYDILPSVGTLSAAMEDGAPVVYPDLGSNIIAELDDDPIEDLFAGADHVVEVDIHNQRLAAIPLEPNNAAAIPIDGGIKVWAGSQHIHGHQAALANILRLERHQVHAIVPDMGGGFGAKFEAYPEQVVTAAAALELGRPVRWQESRTQNLAGMYHGRAQSQHLEVGVTKDGRIVGLKVELVQDVGGYPSFGAYLPRMTKAMASGVYAIPRIETHIKIVTTNTTPTHAYRGAGRPEATAMIERTIDVIATRLGMDPAEVRRKNLISSDAFPYTTATGSGYDSGDYEMALDHVLERGGYHELRAEQARRRSAGGRLQLGLGLSTYVEVTAPFSKKEWSAVEVHEDSTVTVAVGTSSHGQGHATAYAQIIGDLFGIPYTDVEVVQGDTAIVPRGGGTGGSRSLQLGGSAVLGAGEVVLERAKLLMANHLEASSEDIVVTGDGGLGVAGVPHARMSWGEIARAAAHEAPALEEEELGLRGEYNFEQGAATYPFGAHLVVVEVDVETGEVELLRVVTCDDAGTIMNPILIKGQVHGGIAQGVGQALSEAVLYDDEGYLLSANLTSYLIPVATDMPLFEVANTETPTPHNVLGAKGIGEAGTIGSTPAVQNAVIDALSHLGIEHLDMPLTPHKVWEAIQAAPTQKG